MEQEFYMTRLDLVEDSTQSVWNVWRTWKLSIQMKTMLFWMKTVLKENHVYIEKVRAISSQFSYAAVTISKLSS